MTSLFARIRATFGRLDVLVNNAGGHSAAATGRLETEPLSAWKEYLDLNLTGTFLTIRGCALRVSARPMVACSHAASSVLRSFSASTLASVWAECIIMMRFVSV